MATKFIQSEIQVSRGYVEYQGKFIARFKYQAGAARGFANFIAKNFTQEEYFGAIDAGQTPLEIAESKGYVLPHIKKMLKAAGFEVSPDGFRQMIQARIQTESAY